MPPASGKTTTPLGSSDPHATIDLPRAMDFTEARLAEVAARYELEAELGRGGMGIVYRARDKETGERVALKVLKPEIAGEQDLVDRFKNELRLARKITHKRVCRTYELLRFGDTVVIAMEYVEGESLRAVLDRFGGLPLRKGIEVMQQVCSALGEAHAQGIVHRDLKPENLMLDREGNVKVMDFGIARSVEAGSTTTGNVIGTPAYMAPEQAEGKPVDARTDIYALGLILYEAFTGRAAFRAETPVAIALKQIRETPPTPREVEPTIPTHIEKAIVKCLEKNPAKRFQSVADLAAALDREAEVAPAREAAAGEEIPLPLHLSRWERSDWMLLAAGVLASAVTLLLYDRVLPFRTLAPPFSREEAIERGQKLTAKYVLEAKQVEFNAFNLGIFQIQTFPDEVLRRGLGAALKDLQSADNPTWMVQGRSSGRSQLEVEFGRGGGIVSLEARPGSAPSGAGPPATIQEALPAARQYATELFQAPVAGLEPTPYTYNPDQHRWLLAGRATSLQFSRGTPVEWTLPDGATVVVEIEQGRLANAYKILAPVSNPGWPQMDVIRRSWESATRRGFLLLMFCVPLPLALFLGRRLWRQKFREPWALSAILTLTGALIVYADPEPHGLMWWLPYLAGTLFSLLAGYALLSVPQYYLGKVLPVHVRTLSQALAQGLKAQPAGLAVLRGTLLGACYLGTHLALLFLLGRLQWGAAGAGILALFLEATLFMEYQLAPLTGLLALSLAVVITWLLVALPLALLRRTTTRTAALLLGLAVFWGVAAFSLPGAGGFPLFPLYLFAVLQGAWFAWIFLRYDLLTCLSAVLAVITWLLCFPLLRIFGGVDLWSYIWVMVPWALFALWGAVLWFRPELVAWRKRTAAVFE